MPGTKEKILDDLACVAGGAVSVLSGLGRTVREEVRSRIDEIAQRLNLVAREDLTALETRIAALEKQRGAKKQGS